MSKLIFNLQNPLKISLTFVGLMVLLPMINMVHNLPIPSFYSEWIAGVSGLLAVGSLVASKSLNRIEIPQISIVFLGLSAIVMIQWLAGILHSAQYALLIFSYLIWAFLLTILGNHLRKELGLQTIVTTLAFVLLTAGFINIVIVALQIIIRTGGIITFLPHLSSYGPLSQPNHFSDFCTLAIVSATYLYIKDKFSIGFLILIFVCFLFMLALSGSRSSWLYLTILLISAFITKISAAKQNKKSIEIRSLSQITLLTLPLFSLVLIFTTYIVPDGIVDLPTERFIAGVNSSSHRVSIWLDSLHLFFHSPWLGIGTGNMRAESFLIQDTATTFASNSIHENAHNLFLHLLTEMGVGGFLVVVTGLVIWLRNFKWRELNLESWWLITILAILGIHSMLEYPLWYAYFLGIAAILLGAGDEKTLYLNKPENSTNKHDLTSRKAVRITLIIFVLLGVTNLYTMLIANIKLESAIYQSTGLELKKQKKNLQWVQHYSLLSPYAEVILAITTLTDNNNLDSKIALNNSAIRFRPLSKLTYQHALLLDLKGNHDEAIRLLNRSLNIYPTNIKYILEDLPPEYKKHLLQMIENVRPALSNTTHAD